MQKHDREPLEEELELYSRQIVLSEIGYDGQMKISNSRVLWDWVGLVPQLHFS